MPPLSWTQPFDLPAGGAARLELGPLDLHLSHLDGEWQLRSSSAGLHGRPAQLDPSAPAADPELPGRRFGFAQAPIRARFAPALADRPVIIRTEAPFTLLPGEEVRAYVSTPLWVEVHADSGRPRMLCELPTLRPSDTWFGPNVREGLLCYASSTRLRLSVLGAAPPPGRAVTPLVLRNDWSDPMELVRVRLPVRSLRLFADPAGGLWTERVTLRRTREEAEEEVVIDGEAPRESAGGQQVRAPREPRGHSFTLRAFEPLFRLP